MKNERIDASKVAYRIATRIRMYGCITIRTMVEMSEGLVPMPDGYFDFRYTHGWDFEEKEHKCLGDYDQLIRMFNGNKGYFDLPMCVELSFKFK